MAKNTTKKTVSSVKKGAVPPATKKIVAQPAAIETATVSGAGEPTPAQVLEWWPNSRGEAIVAMMKDIDLPYFRAVKRSRRYFLEGKLS